MKPGKALRKLRHRNGLTVREVEAASRFIAATCGNPRFVLVPSRLSALEIRDAVPSLFGLHSLSLIYGCSMARLCSLFGVDFRRDAAARQQVQQFLQGCVQPRLARQRRRELAREQKRRRILQRKMQREKRQKLVVRLRRRGLTYSEVARRTGLTITQVNYAMTGAGQAGLRIRRAPRPRRRPRADNR